jgi:hypothetical protein
MVACVAESGIRTLSSVVCDATIEDHERSFNLSFSGSLCSRSRRTISMTVAAEFFVLVGDFDHAGERTGFHSEA